MSAHGGACASPPKLKREQPEPLAPADLAPDHAAQARQPTPQLRPPPNGFHSADLFTDILTSKYTSLAHHAPAAKHDKIRLMLEDSISEGSRSRVQDIFSQVEQLKTEEKLLLYLKFPVALTNTNGAVDPLRQPLNPLGNRYEIHQTIMWIKTHLEEDQEVSLPKQEVYDEYNLFCLKNSMKPLSTADFGKVMKQVYPRVRPRRLGTRGNSRYCYAGMRKRIKLDPPALPPTMEEGENAESNVKEEMLGAASTLIREWAESLLDAKFSSLCALGKYLVNNLCVDNRTLAAVCILSGSGEAEPIINKDTNAGLSSTPVPGKAARLREAQLQLQRKLVQREHSREQKDKHFDGVLQNEKREKTGEQSDENFGAANNKKGKKGKAIANNLSQGINALNKLNATAVVSAGRQKKVLKSNNQSCSISLQSNCDNLVVQSIQDEQNSNASRLVTNDNAISPKEVKSKYTRKRASSVNVVAQASESSPEKQAKLGERQNGLENVTRSLTPGYRLFCASASAQQSAKISVILASNLHATKSNKTICGNGGSVGDTLGNLPSKTCDKESSVCSEDHSKSNGSSSRFDAISKPNIFTNDQIRRLQENSTLFAKEKLCSIDSDALNDYLNGGNNSQEQEEELLQYFQQSNSSSSDLELSAVVGETEQNSRQDKVSQLRIILQENLRDSVLTDCKPRSQSVAVDKSQIMEKQNLILPTLLNHNNTPVTRRRVSFEAQNTNVTAEQGHDNSSSANVLVSNTVPQSPNTRRRIFNFTPISPGPQSPINGRASKSSSANASPFVSPRNTPVPRSRSNLQGNCRSQRNTQKILSRSVSCNVPCLGNRNESATFIVPTSGQSEQQVRLVHSPLASLNKASQACQLVQSASPLPACTPFLADITSQEPQLLINYPSQENLQEIKNIHQKSLPTDREISEFLQNEKQHYVSREQLFYRSQSVPLHRMVNPALLSPISTHQLTPNFLSSSFNPSTSSSVVPTPVPSEFNDFVSLGPCDNSNYLLDVDPLVSADQQFLIEDKEIIPENLGNIFDILNDEESNILRDETCADKQTTIDSNTLIIDSLPNENLDDGILLPESAALVDSWTNESNTENVANVSKMLHSRSYPNTPVPVPLSNSSFGVQYPEANRASRSSSATPLHNLHSLQQQSNYASSNEPMLYSPNLNTPSLQNQTTDINNVCSTSVECSVADFLERDLTNEANDLGSLSNFDGLQDVGALSPLFTEVVESNH